MKTLDSGFLLTSSLTDFGKPAVVLVLASTLASPAIADSRISLDGATAEACFMPGADCAAAVVSAISSARRRVWLLGYGFTERRIVDALGDARRRGVDVRLVLDRSNVDGGTVSAAAYVAKLGIPIRIDRSVRIAHNKTVLIDGDTVVTGSMNFTRAGTTQNAENVHILRGARELAERHATYFLEREAVSEVYRVSPAGPTTRP